MRDNMLGITEQLLSPSLDWREMISTWLVLQIETYSDGMTRKRKERVMVIAAKESRSKKGRDRNKNTTIQLNRKIELKIRDVSTSNSKIWSRYLETKDGRTYADIK